MTSGIAALLRRLDRHPDVRTFESETVGRVHGSRFRLER
jgi:hypothetical protein